MRDSPHISFLHLATVVLVVAAVATAAVGCGGVSTDPVVLDVDTGRQERPDEESWNVQYAISNDGETRVRISAPYMAKYTKDDSTYLLLTRIDSNTGDAVLAEMFDPDSDRTTTIRTDELRFFDRSRRYELRGNVQVTTSTGRHLETDFLVWNEEDGRVLAPGFVHITSPTENLQGYGLDSDEMLENFQLNRVTGRYYVEE